MDIKSNLKKLLLLKDAVLIDYHYCEIDYLNPVDVCIEYNPNHSTPFQDLYESQLIQHYATEIINHPDLIKKKISLSFETSMLMSSFIHDMMIINSIYQQEYQAAISLCEQSALSQSYMSFSIYNNFVQHPVCYLMIRYIETQEIIHLNIIEKLNLSCEILNIILPKRGESYTKSLIDYLLYKDINENMANCIIKIIKNNIYDFSITEHVGFHIIEQDFDKISKILLDTLFKNSIEYDEILFYGKLLLYANWQLMESLSHYLLDKLKDVNIDQNIYKFLQNIINNQIICHPSSSLYALYLLTNKKQLYFEPETWPGFMQEVVLSLLINGNFEIADKLINNHFDINLKYKKNLTDNMHGENYSIHVRRGKKIRDRHASIIEHLLAIPNIHRTKSLEFLIKYGAQITPHCLYYINLYLDTDSFKVLYAQDNILWTELLTSQLGENKHLPVDSKTAIHGFQDYKEKQNI